MATELISISSSEDFVHAWTRQERKQFKEFFLSWLYDHVWELPTFLVKKF
jgi:hypothetical protein